MNAFGRFLARGWNFLRNDRGDARLREEIAEHLTLLAEENIRAGMLPEQALREAGLKLGSVEAVRERYRAEAGLPFIENLFEDCRYALRQFRRSPGYAAAAVLTLALGIGANTGIFLLTYTILLSGLPVPDPGRLIRYCFEKGESDMDLSYGQYRAIEARQGVATGVFAWHDDTATLRRNGRAEKVPIALTTGSVFPVLELQLALGRGFPAQAGESGVQTGALLSYEFWRSEFGGDPSILGQALSVEGHNVTVVGVLPRGFEGIEKDSSPFDVLLPLSFDRILQPVGAMIDEPGAFWLTVMGRLQPGETLSDAQANLSSIRNEVNSAADPAHLFLTGDGFFSSYKLAVESGRAGRSVLRSRYGRPLLVLEALCGLMMVLCSLNVSLLQHARIIGRLQEFALRSALGAASGRIFAQVLAEAVLLGCGGLSIGGLIGWNLAKLLVRMISAPGIPPAIQLHGGVEVLLFAALVTVGAAIMAGMWPAWRASHTPPAVYLKQTTSSVASRRLGRWIISAQVALGVVLLNIALLLANTLTTYLREHSGFHADNAVLSTLDMNDAGVSETLRAGKSFEFLRRVKSMPGVQSAALLSMAPIDNSFNSAEFYVRDSEGHLTVNHQIWQESVSEDYFVTMGTRILEGRAFNATDASGDSTCILSAGAAAFYFPDGGPLGRTLSTGDGTEKPADQDSCRIVGVAEDVRFGSLLQPAPRMVYFPFEHERTDSAAFAYTTLAVQAARPSLARAAIIHSWGSVFPGAALPRMWRFGDAITYNLSQQRLLSSISGGFALLALALVATGFYGILARAVLEQRREIGIRIALGSKRRQVVSRLARSTGISVLCGLVAGAILTALSGRVLRSQLSWIEVGNDATIGVLTVIVLAAVLVLAFVLPAARAATVNPMDAIRQE